MAINNITELKEQVLDKPETKLSAKEVKALNSVDKKTYDGMKDAIASQKFELKDKKGVACNVYLKDIVQNFDVRDNTFKIQDHEFQVGTKTELSAWIQLYLITHGKSVYNDKQGDPTKKLGIDGVIGGHTKSAIENIKVKNTTSEKKEKVSTVEGSLLGLMDIKNKPLQFAFATKFSQKVADAYQSRYDLFNAEGKFDAQYFEGKSNITIYYKNPYDGRTTHMNEVTIQLKDIQNSSLDKSISIDKFLNNVKSQIDDKEHAIKMNSLSKEINSATNNVSVEKFSPLIKTYVEAKDWVTNGDLDLKRGIGTGMEIKGQNLSVAFPSGKEYLININNLQSTGKFDEKKLMTELTKILKPQAETWKNSLN